MMKFAFFAAVAMAAFAPVGAQAATVTFDTDCSSSTGTIVGGKYVEPRCSTTVESNAAIAGNSLIMAGKNQTTGDYNLALKISAWQVDQSSSAINSAFLGVYSGGLGVTGIGDIYGNTNGAGGTHQIDNANGKSDFVLLQFSQAVNLQSMAYNIFGGAAVGTDSDMTIYNAAAIAPTVWNGTTNITTLISGGFYNADNQFEAAGPMATTTPAAGTQTPGAALKAYSGSSTAAPYGSVFSKVWLVGASSVNTAHDDSFKLASIIVTTATPAVPEPATWAMMIAGFGLVGASLRRRRAGETPLAA